MISLIWEILKMQQMSEYSKKKKKKQQNQVYREQNRVISRERETGRGKKEILTIICKTSYKARPWPRGLGWEKGREAQEAGDICIVMSDLHCCTTETRAFLVAQPVKNPPVIQEPRRCRFNPWVRKIPWRRAWQSTPIALPGKSYGQRSLAGYSH